MPRVGETLPRVSTPLFTLRVPNIEMADEAYHSVVVQFREPGHRRHHGNGEG